MEEKTKYFQKLGTECYNNMRKLNPKGGMEEFIRIAVEFGYKRATEKLTTQNVNKRFSFTDFVIGLIAGILGAIITLSYLINL